MPSLPAGTSSLLVRRGNSLFVGDAKIPCQMEQLASATPSLHNILRSDCFRSGNCQEVRLPDGLHVQAVQSAVEFIAEGKIDANKRDASSVLECAELFQMDSAKEACLRSLSETVSTENCIQLRQLATHEYASRLAAHCDTVIVSYITELLDHEDFLNLPRVQANVEVSAQLLEFSTDAGIMERLLPKVTSRLGKMSGGSDRVYLEEGVVNLVILPDFSVETASGTRSSRFSSPERPSLVAQLRKTQPSPARKLILDESMATEGVDEDYVTTGESTWKVIATAKLSEISSVSLVERGKGLGLCVLNLRLLTEGEQVFPKSPTTGIAAAGGTSLFAQMNEARAGFSTVVIDGEVLAIGGFNRRGCLSSAERYNFPRNQWEILPEMDSKRARFSVVNSAGVLYAIGGCDGKQELRSMEVLDQRARSWKKLKPSMITPRSCFGAAELDGKIYAIGGSHYSTPIKASEVFDPSARKWVSIPSMLTARCELAVTACNGKIYAVGGQKSGWNVLATVESYDPADKRWRKEASLNTPRRNAAVVTIEDRIFVIGGYDGSKPVNSVEVYDPLTGEWIYAKPMAVRRSNAAAVVLDGSVYMIGGYTGSQFLNSVECFNPEGHQWTSFISH